MKKTGISEVARAIPRRRPESHKGDFGRLLIVGGSERYVGAPVLAGLAALRSGVDWVTIAAPEKVAWAINSISPDLTTLKLPCANLEPSVLPKIFAEMGRSTAVAVGPGVGESPETAGAVLKLAEKIGMAGMPAIYDADGLKALAKNLKLLQGKPWVLTPHRKEFKVLSGVDLPEKLSARAGKVRDFAARVGCTVLLKSNVDVISSEAGEVKLNHTGNPGMTVGGTGDVLAGIVGAFLAQRNSPFDAAAAGAWVCGRAGDLCLKEKGYEFLASDVILKLPDVFREVRRGRHG